MDTTPIDLSHLFDQLGLASDPQDINQFIAAHPLEQHTHLSEAPFWNTAQKSFLNEALAEDAQWTELIEQLDTLLRKK